MSAIHSSAVKLLASLNAAHSAAQDIYNVSATEAQMTEAETTFQRIDEAITSAGRLVMECRP